VTHPLFDRGSIESVVASACRAPSIHNTQPWRWELRDDTLDVRADRSRQLHVADRDGHSLLISCGAAAELTDIALRAQGWQFERTYQPVRDDSDLLVRFRATGRAAPDPVATTQLEAAQVRRSERRAFDPGPISDDVIEQLRQAAGSPGVYAHFPARPDDNIHLAVAISQADRSERDDPAYAAELARWVHDDDGTRDGVPASVIPQIATDSPRHTDIPLRDFEIGIPGGQLMTAGTDERPLIVVVFTESDDDLQRLRAGQAMMRLMIEAERAGIASCPLSQSLDLAAFRARLRTLMSWIGDPQMMLRLGQRPTGHPAPLTPRRTVEEVLTVSP
jgi:nitroreductase